MDRGNIVWLVLAMVCCVVSAVGVWVYMDSKIHDDDHETKWPRHHIHEFDEPDQELLNESKARVERVRDAIQRYQRDLGETYYPEDLQILVEMDYLDDADTQGVLSRGPL